MKLALDSQPLRGRTGHGVRIAVVDSGVAIGHPHIGAVHSGVSLLPRADANDFADRIGHGTAVAAAIREKAPGADLIAVRVFDRTLATNAALLADAIRWTADEHVHLINLSLGTSNASHEGALGEAVEYALARNVIVVAARESDGVRWLPGSLGGVVGVEVDWSLERDAVEVLSGLPSIVRASGLPRPIPGVPPERNLSGVSFAVANASGFLARVFEALRSGGQDPFPLWRAEGLAGLLAGASQP